jgi:cell division FtsZ-interacting protein ZapD
MFMLKYANSKISTFLKLEPIFQKKDFFTFSTYARARASLRNVREKFKILLIFEKHWEIRCICFVTWL